ncbi:MAG: Do family serine endopeptidase [Fidelibacterota bacterium]
MKKRLAYSWLSIVFLVSTGWGQLPAARELSKIFTEVAERVNPAVVTITSTKVIKPPGMRFRHPWEEFFGEDFFSPFQFPQSEMEAHVLGSGVIVDPDRGYILTNNHVVEGAEEVRILLMDERRLDAEIVGTDAPSDVAVLRIDTDGLVGVTPGNSDDLKVGEWVLAIGSPFSRNLSHSVTAGIVSAKGRSGIVGGVDYEDFIQTDAAINPGNSGGALVNLDGELVGINTAIATGGFSRGNVGVGFAIPINLAKRVMDDLIAEGRVVRAWLGVYIQDVNDALARSWGLSDREGAAVTMVIDGSPADKAGFEVEDVIVEFDGKKVKNSSNLKNLVSSTRPGTRVTVDVIRDRRRKSIRVKLAELPEKDEILAAAEESPHGLGLRVENLSLQMASRLGLDKGQSGVVVVEVEPVSAASDAGLQRGDVITRVGDREINSVEEFYSAVEKEQTDGTVVFLVKRGQGTFFLALDVK